jgi:hypothetical protein
MEQAKVGYEYPRVYRAAGFWRWFFLIVGPLGFVGFSYLAWQIAQELKGVDQVLFPSLIAGIAFAALYMTAYVLRANLTLRQGEVELNELTSNRTMRHDEILGYRTGKVNQGPDFLILYPRDKDKKKLRIPTMFAFDSTFHDWIGSFPNLDERDAEGAKEEIENNPELGMTVEERAASAQQARVVCRGLSVLSGICCLWAWIYPYPYELAVLSLVILPWIAIYVTARYKGVVVINQKRGDRHPTAIFAFLFPSLVLPLRVIPDMVPVVWQRPVLLGAMVAVMLTYAAYRADRATQKQPVIALVLFLLAIGYGYGTVMEANALLDRTPGKVYLTMVERKYVSTGKSASYHLVLAPWGPMERGDNVTVTRQFYQASSEGAPVCVMLRSGAVGVPWYRVRRCE